MKIKVQTNGFPAFSNKILLNEEKVVPLHSYNICLLIMMTKEQHIDYWINSAEEDWLSVEVLLDRKRYLHCLFWAHLTLEKLSKAIWVKHHAGNLPPKIHNIVWLLDNSIIDLGKDRMAFLANFNDFQLSSRYPDYLNKIQEVCTESFTLDELEKVKEIRTCLREMLQSK